MPIRTADQSRSAILTTLEERLSGIRTDAGEPIVDLADGVSIESERTSVHLEYCRRINSLAGWRSVISDEAFKQQLADALGIGYGTASTAYLRSIGGRTDAASDVEALIERDLDDFAASFGRRRREATFATATLRLTLASSGPYSLARGATVRRGASTTVFYDTTENVSVAAPAQDPTTGSFYVEVAARCRSAGRIGNAVRGAINASVGTLPGVVAISNITPAEGGFERETNLELVEALGNIQSGTNINTLEGVLNWVKGQSGVSDAVLVGPGDPLMTRSPAGAVDIYIIGSKAVSAQATTVIGAAGEAFTLPFQPVKSITSVVDNLGNAYFFEGGFTFDDDADGAQSKSSKAHAQILWDLPAPDGAGPPAGRTMTIGYSFDSLVRDIQRKLDTDPRVNVPATNILIRLGTLVGATCQMVVVPIAGIEDLGISQQDVNLAVESALSTFFESRKLGFQADFSDALVAASDAVINGEKVVDRIDGFVMGKTGDVLGLDNLSVSPNEYLRLDTITFLA